MVMVVVVVVVVVVVAAAAISTCWKPSVVNILTRAGLRLSQDLFRIRST